MVTRYYTRPSRGGGVPLPITHEELCELLKAAEDPAAIGRSQGLPWLLLRPEWGAEEPIGRRLDARTPRILTPDECRTLLSVCWQRWPRFIPPLALMMFAGIRPYEVGRLTWGSVDLEHGVVRIDGAVSKVRARRIVRNRPLACNANQRRTGGNHERTRDHRAPRR